jgi:alpha-galactosidase
VDYVKYDLCSYGGIISEQTRRFVLEQIPAHAAEYEAAGKERDELRHVAGKDRTPAQAARLQALDEQIKTLEAAVDPEKRRQFNLAQQQRPYEVFGQSLAKVPRDIIYSFCQYGNADVWKWGASLGGNSWRTTGDISANWKSMTGIGFRQNELAPYAGPGHWNDPDMLEIGNQGLSPDECYTHMTLWSLLAAPLLIGCDMTKMDPLTVSLFSNDEVLAVNQDALGKQGYRLRQDGGQEVWIKPLDDGSVAVGLFNRGEATARIRVSWNELNPKIESTGGSELYARDLWRQRELPTVDEGVELPVAAHGAELLRVRRTGAP